MKKTLIISSSLNPESKSYQMCKMICDKMLADKKDVELLDVRDYELGHTFRTTPDMQKISEKIAAPDNFIIGMAVYCYTVNDSLKSILDNCFSEVTGKKYGIVCAAGGEKSYLATQHLTQICANEWRMIQLPRVVYASGKDWKEGKLINNDVVERMDLFVEEFEKFVS